ACGSDVPDGRGELSVDHAKERGQREIVRTGHVWRPSTVELTLVCPLPAGRRTRAAADDCKGRPTARVNRSAFNHREHIRPDVDTRALPQATDNGYDAQLVRTGPSSPLLPCRFIGNFKSIVRMRMRLQHGGRHDREKPRRRI